MRDTILLVCLFIGLFFLYIMFWPSHSHDPGGHNHDPVEQQEAPQPTSSPDSITHDNIDSQ